jgi:hypothetical protein
MTLRAAGTWCASAVCVALLLLLLTKSLLSPSKASATGPAQQGHPCTAPLQITECHVSIISLCGGWGGDVTLVAGG